MPASMHVSLVTKFLDSSETMSCSNRCRARFFGKTDWKGGVPSPVPVCLCMWQAM